MEGSPLRSLAAPPPGSIEPAEALAHVVARLPDVDAHAAEALALVVLVGRARADAAAPLGRGPATRADLPPRAPKARRRPREPLPADGWCERAERLISD